MTQQFTKSEEEQLLSTVLDVGEAMLKCGGEVSRVEDTMERICRAYEVERVNPFVITSSIVMTIQFHDGSTVTQTRRIHGNTTDFTQLEALNHLSRSICASPPPVAELNERYRTIMEMVKKEDTFYRNSFLAYLVAAGIFAVFFGGNLWDGLCAAVIASFIWFLDHTGRKIIDSQLLYLLLASFLMGIGAMLLYKTGLPVHQDKIMIGDIMLLIPGLLMTNAVRDIFSGDTISGMLRLSESLLMAGMIAAGTAGAILLMGGRG